MSPLAERIRRYRRASGLSQQEVADRLHLAQQTVQQWEAGKTTPRGENLTRLARALEVSPSELAYGGATEKADRVRPVPILTADEIPTAIRRTPPQDHAPADAQWITPPRAAGPLVFAMTVEDPYLEPVVRRGDVIIVDPDCDLAHLDLVLARIGAAVHAVQYHSVGRKRWVASLSEYNAFHAPIQRAQIVGVILSKVRLFR